MVIKIMTDHTKSSMTPKAVVLDFDGVILESVDIKTEAFLELFTAYPEHQDAIRRYHLDNLGISRFHKFNWIYSELLRQPLSEKESWDLGESFSEIVLAKILSCPFVPGALQLLEGLHPFSLLFVASGTPQEELERIVSARQIGHFFTEVWGTPAGKMEIISSIMSRFALASSEVLFIGDAVSDYKAAEGAGVPFLARQTDDQDSWRKLGVPSVPDLIAARPLLGLPH